MKTQLGWILLGGSVGIAGLLVRASASEALGVAFALLGFGATAVALVNLALDLIQSD